MSSHTHIKRSDTPGHENLTRKRRKGATRLSCAECRRLKLRCDRAVPCGSCQKRGCAAICPDGSLTTGQGNRFVLASTQELHEKISQLANRVRELEDALRSSHNRLSSDIHPLLTEELLRIKAPLQREASSFRTSINNPTKEEEPNPDVVDAFGSLSISITGRAKYFGQTANSWYFLQNESPEDEEDDGRLANLQNILPPEIITRSAAFPIAPTVVASLEAETARLKSLFWYLPLADKASELRQIYFWNAAWMYTPISPEAFTEIFNRFYDPNSAPIDAPLLSHHLALVFMVMAIGSLMDIKQPAYNVEAEKYHQLARAALFQNQLFDEPSINAVQSLFLMSFYLFLADRHGTNSGTRWAVMGLATKVAQSIGLHRDSGRWKVEPEETQRRRELFWELYTYDSWQCLTFGRPPSFSLAHIDCKMPHLTEPSDEQTFHAWKHRFSSECMSIVHDQAFGAKTPTYATILQLDRKMRAFPVPAVLQVAGFGSSEPRPGGYPETIMLTLQRHIVLAIREMNLLYLHRSFFARAVSDHPKDPLGSPYGTSVIAAYRSAGSLVALMRNLHAQLKEPSERIWFLWTHMFSCGIVLGSIVTRCPSMSLAPSALLQLDSACELFSKAAHGFRARKVLSILLLLQEKAHLSLSEFRQGKSPISPRQGSISEPVTPVDDNDELSTLGGKTRLVAKKEYSSPSSPAIIDRSPTSHNPVVPLPLPYSDNHPVHPSVAEYLRTFVPAPASETLNGTYPSQAFSSESTFGLSSLPTTPAYASEPVQYQHPSHLQHDSQMSMGVPTNSFPQYFPVYDYGQGGGSESGFATPTPIITEPRFPSTHHRPGSLTPEANMQTTWQDFVDGLGM